MECGEGDGMGGWTGDEKGRRYEGGNYGETAQVKGHLKRAMKT